MVITPKAATSNPTPTPKVAQRGNSVWEELSEIPLVDSTVWPPRDSIAKSRCFGEDKYHVCYLPSTRLEVESIVTLLVEYAKRERKYGITLKCSLFCEYLNLE